MERRYVLFIAASLAIVLASQALQMWLLPKPPVKQAAPEQPAGDEPPPELADAAIGAASQRAKPSDAPSASAETSDAAETSGADEPAAESERAPRVRFSLGSLDPASPAGMLVTLTSRGAAVERIELADTGFVDQKDKQ